MTVYFYGRCSSIENFDKGSSLETQLSKCQSYAHIKDLTIDEIFEEQSSGTVPFERRNRGFEIMQNLCLFLNFWLLKAMRAKKQEKTDPFLMFLAVFFVFF